MAVPEENPFVRDPPTEFEPVDRLSEERAREQAELLREAIRFHDRRYYVENDPVIADRTYDALFDRLQALEEAFDLRTDDSPTRRVGGEPVDEFDTVEHVAPMLSIEASADAEDVRAFDERVRETLGEPTTYVCEPKFDGVSLELVYEDGRLDRAVTRGDGRRGDDVTRNVRTVREIPQRLRGDPPESLAVRGELYMPRDGFQKYNRERVERGEEPFANPRNATAGTIRQQDPSVVADRPLAFFAFEVLAASDPWSGRMAEHEALAELGFPVSDRVEPVEDIEGAIDYRDRLLADRDDLNYEVDGAVVKVNGRAARDRLGATSRHPRWAYAYKFPARTDVTTVRDIAVQVGRTGRLTPVALLDPVDVGGVTVSRASLHNPEQIAALDVGIGDRVRIERAGDVIPQVVEVVEDESKGSFEFPEECPACGSPVERDGPIARCTGGVACPAQRRQAIEHYAGPNGLDVEGLGERTIDQLVDAGLVETPADLYELDREDLRELEGFGERSADNLLAAIDESRSPPLGDFLAALGLPEVGPTIARELAREFRSVQALLEADEDRLETVEGVGPVVADRVRGFLSEETNRELIERLLEHVSPQPPEDVDVDETFEGKTIVFTGSLPTMTRSEATEAVERRGGRVTSTVSSNTDLLVVGENPGTRKREAADERGVRIADGDEFERLLDGDTA